MKQRAIGIFIIFVMLGSAGPVLAQQEDQLAAVELQAMADTFQYALENNPTNEASDWVNPDTTRSGAVVPTRTFENSQGEPCREFVTTIIIANQEEQGYGTACRQPDGSWSLVSDETQTAPERPPVTTRTYIEHAPPAYYAYPSGFFGRYNIYLSFGHVYRSGHLHSGYRYSDGRSFRTRNSFNVVRRVNYGPRISYRYRLHDELNYRDWDRHSRGESRKDYDRDRKSDRKWREDNRDDDRGRSKHRGGHK
jgi:surface antigen